MKTIIIAAVLSLASLMAQTSRIYVQWSTWTAKGFEPVQDWSKLPLKPYMKGAIDNSPGWIAALKIDGKILSECDHYAIVADAKQAHITSYCWMDGQGISWGHGAKICTHEPLNCTYYGEPTLFWQERGNKPVFPLAAFKPPSGSLIRHGIYLPNSLWSEHKKFW